VLIESLEQIEAILDVPDVALRLAHRFWPGPLTIVLKRLEGDGTLGVRCPGHDFLRVLAGRVGPLSVTSANRHGEATPATVDEVLEVLTGPVPLAIDGGPCDGVASTVVDATGTELVIIRAGPISAEEIEAVALR
jgi:L-threonylcarbamoyladenylate synthase